MSLDEYSERCPYKCSNCDGKATVVHLCPSCTIKNPEFEFEISFNEPKIRPKKEQIAYFQKSLEIATSMHVYYYDIRLNYHVLYFINISEYLLYVDALTEFFKYATELSSFFAMLSGEPIYDIGIGFLNYELKRKQEIKFP